MKKILTYFILPFILAPVLLASCGEDRSGEYYALISTKTWMYETMQQNYLFYNDIPAESELDFFRKPSEFLKSAASSRDQKNGVLFSHIDSVFNETRTRTSQYPSYGIEGALVRNAAGDNVVHVLYTYPNSPASEAGLKRGDWIIEADSQKINSSNYEQYIERPMQAYNYKIARKNTEEKNDTIMVKMPAPRVIEEPSVLMTKSIQAGNQHAYYILYNSFEAENENELREAFANIPSNTTDIILDLRYNPGGSVSTAILLGTYLAPSNAMNQKCVDLIPNDKINKVQTYNFDPQLLAGGNRFDYRNLYILTTSNTASASELVINCLRPYMTGKLFQVGEATFGKNVAQSLFKDPLAPKLEFWLTTAYISNSKGEYEYYEEGLKPDFLLEENLAGELGEFGTPQDSLLRPVLYHIENGSFPQTTAPKTRVASTSILYNSITKREKKAQLPSHFSQE